MSVLEKTKKHLTIMGIRVIPKASLPECLQPFRLTINRVQILIVTILFGTWIITFFCTLIFEAKKFTEFTNALTYVTVGCVHSSHFYLSLWKYPQIMAFFDDLEEAIEKSNV